MSESKTATKSKSNGNQVAQSALQNAGVNMIICNQNLNITFINDASMVLFRENEALFKEAFGSFSPDSVLGTCIDDFHVDKQRIRDLLANPSNLPHRADITVGPKIFSLNVSGVFDDKGDYIGNCLEWQDVTEDRSNKTEAARMSSAIGGSATAQMTVDLDFTITGMNAATEKLITSNIAVFNEAFPGIDFGNAMGVCIDVFHKDPAYQRNILGNPANLPHQADINIGPMTFVLNISAMYDANGKHIGSNLEWNDATEQRKQENEAARMTSAIQGSSTPQMTVDLDLTITSMNPATVKLITDNIGEFQGAFPGIDFGDAIGVCIDIFHKNPAHQRQILGNPANLPHQADINVGSLTFALNISAMYDADGKHLGSNLEWQNVTTQRAAATRAEALFSQMDGATALFMTCDLNLDVTYVNPSLLGMFRLHHAKIKAALPAFDSEKLIGFNIDNFHVNPAHQRQLLANTAALPATVEIKVGELEFQVTATALFDDQGNHIGNGAEWGDLNDRAAYRDEVQRVIDASNSGDLSYRGQTNQLSEVYVPMMTGINEIIDAIVAPINEASGVLEQVAQRDLTARVTGDYEGDHAKIKNNLNSAVENLEGAMTQARDASAEVNSAGEQISTGAQSLAQGASEQASSLEEISASLEELTAMTNQNADSAVQATSLSDEAKGISDKGIVAMSKMSEAINLIKDSAEQTAKIIKTIDEIAFQTNLLALNAAVEAARAGDAGKGFAVVAEEVRSLAARSAEAARNTAELIEQSGKNAEGGVRISEEVASALDEIQSQTAKVAELMAEISAGSKEQAAGIGQINDGVTQLDSVTQKNAASSEESAAAAEELTAQARSLQGMIAAFKLGTAGGAAAQYAAPPQQSFAPPAANGFGAAPAAPAANANDVIPMGDDGLMEF